MIMDCFKGTDELTKYVPCDPLAHPLALIWLSETVFQQISPLCILSHYVGHPALIKSFNQANNVRVSTTHFNGHILRYTVLAFIIFVNTGLHPLNCHFLLCDFMDANHNLIA